MNTRILLNVLFVFLLASCSKDAEIVNELNMEIHSHSKAANTTYSTMCSLDDANAEIVPLCTANPADFADTAFPVYVFLNGERIPYDGYSYEWSTGSNGSAIAISYNDLPISLILIEEATGCQATLILDENYWGKEGGGIVPVNNNHLPTSMALPEGSTDGGTEGEESQRF